MPSGRTPGRRALLLPPGWPWSVSWHPDDIDISLWRPYFGRRVRHVLLEDKPADILSPPGSLYRGGRGVLLSGTPRSPEWQQQVGAELVATTTVTLKVAQGPVPW